MSNETSPPSEPVATLVARVFALVRACPVGRVTTYGWLAKAVGYPRGARMVGWIMNETPEGVPAQRVINSKGELSGSWAFGRPGVMRQLLEQATSARKAAKRQVEFSLAAAGKLAQAGRIADALQLATSLATGCSALVTNDRRLPTVPGLRVIQLGAYVG